MVMAYLGLLIRRHGHELNPKAAEYAKIAMDGAERMRQLIDDLLAYSRIESNKAVRTPVDLNHVARSVVSDLRMAIEEADAEVDVESLPVVYADEAQMVQVLQNLIGNAVKFRGAEPPRVKISSKRRIGEWVISVKDNGIRIDPRHQDDLFKMFHRLHGRAEYPGTGIGLAITKKIVERHGGRIWFESEPGKGTTFHFTMPGMT
jgi:signal transduction histidine kinase